MLVILSIAGFIFRQQSRKSKNRERLDPHEQLGINLPAVHAQPLPADSPIVETNRFIVTRDNHPISRKNISSNALKVLHRLTDQGYEAYLVGGCIRDLYQDIHPKDFDVATSATPEEVRRIFRNSRLIGRRFKLAHIVFGRETIEVATFRAGHDGDNPTSDQSHHSETGRILRDNVYGTIEDDARRRDFTINALYYDSRHFTVTDYCGGIGDIQQQQIRLIGDPTRRYHEDPVRMLRAIRFTAKLNFTMVEETSAPIFQLAHLLKDIPSARLFDEVLKLLQSGQGVKTFALLRKYCLLEHLFPATNQCINDHDEYFEALIIQALMSTDNRIKQSKSVTPAFLFAALLWKPMKRELWAIESQGIPPIPALHQASMTALTDQSRHTTIPKRFSIAIRDIWDLQNRLEHRQPRTIEALMGHQRFRAAYDLLVLREESGELLEGVGRWWTDLQEVGGQDRQQMITALRNQNKHKSSRQKRCKKRKPKKSSGDSSEQTTF